MRHVVPPAIWLIPAAQGKLLPWSSSPAQSGGVQLHILSTVNCREGRGSTPWWKAATGVSWLAKWRDRAAQSEAEKGEPRCAVIKQVNIVVVLVVSFFHACQSVASVQKRFKNWSIKTDGLSLLNTLQHTLPLRACFSSGCSFVNRIFMG